MASTRHQACASHSLTWGARVMITTSIRPTPARKRVPHLSVWPYSDLLPCVSESFPSSARATIPAVCPDYPGSDQPKRCRTADDCPVMHQCTFPDQKALGLGYCCPMPKQKCLTQPPLWHSQKYPSNDECSVHIPNACPLNYSCQLAEAGFKKCCLDPGMLLTLLGTIPPWSYCRHQSSLPSVYASRQGWAACPDQVRRK